MSAAYFTRKQLTAVICLALAAGTMLVYLPMLGHGFVNYDDPDYITNNPHVQAGLTWPGIVWAFQSSDASNWHPLTWISHMMDCQLFGLNPARPPFDQPAFSHGECAAAVHGVETNDWSDVVQRVCGSAVCMASAARRIRRVGFRTQGCVERVFLDADAAGLRALRTGAGSKKQGAKFPQPKSFLLSPFSLLHLSWPCFFSPAA